MDSVTITPTGQPVVPVTCDRYYTKTNHTHIIYGGYEGIPENLLINVVIWLVSFVLHHNKFPYGKVRDFF